MNPTASQSVIDLLLASGVPSREEAAQLAQNLNGGSWTSQVLDSGKVDEQRFLSVIGNFFRVPVVSIDPKRKLRSCSRPTIFSILSAASSCRSS